jgi:mono/diheme cytochrome c family protein
MKERAVQRRRARRRVARRSALVVLALSLVACAAGVRTSGAPADPAAPAGGGAEPAAVASAADGARAFRDTCAPCHGEDGRGGAGGGPPLDAVADPELIVSMVNYGRGSMSPLAGMLTTEQVRAVAAYVTTELFK